MSWLRVGAIAVLGASLGVWGCGSSTPTASTPTTYEQKTETFAGTLNTGELKAFHFTVTNPGSIDAAITALGPVSTLTMGLHLGGWDATTETCSRALPLDTARLNQVLSGTPQSAGEYCVAIYDVGNVQSPVDFTITLLHY
jgi:hypothetical protein